jgi:hypothetical protein
MGDDGAGKVAWPKGLPGELGAHQPKGCSTADLSHRSLGEGGEARPAAVGKWVGTANAIGWRMEFTFNPEPFKTNLLF